MSTVNTKLKYLWSAYFEDGAILHQNKEDKYSKHVEGAEHNPSAFRDILDYQEKSPLSQFCLNEVQGDAYYSVYLRDGVFGASLDHAPAEFSLEDTPLIDRKLIFFRQVQQNWINGVAQEPRVARYCIGYEGKNPQGKVEKKVIYIDG